MVAEKYRTPTGGCRAADRNPEESTGFCKPVGKTDRNPKIIVVIVSTRFGE